MNHNLVICFVGAALVGVGCGGATSSAPASAAKKADSAAILAGTYVSSDSFSVSRGLFSSFTLGADGTYSGVRMCPGTALSQADCHSPSLERGTWGFGWNDGQLILVGDPIQGVASRNDTVSYVLEQPVGPKAGLDGSALTLSYRSDTQVFATYSYIRDDSAKLPSAIQTGTYGKIAGSSLLFDTYNFKGDGHYYTSFTTQGTGTWSLDGSQLTMTDKGRQPVTYTFSFDGTALTLVEANGNVNTLQWQP